MRRRRHAIGVARLKEAETQQSKVCLYNNAVKLDVRAACCILCVTITDAAAPSEAASTSRSAPSNNGSRTVLGIHLWTSRLLWEGSLLLDGWIL